MGSMDFGYIFLVDSENRGILEVRAKIWLFVNHFKASSTFSSYINLYFYIYFYTILYIPNFYIYVKFLLFIFLSNYIIPHFLLKVKY